MELLWWVQPVKLADLQKKRLRDVTTAHKRVLAELDKLEKQALKAVGPLVRVAAQFADEFGSVEKAAGAGQSELGAAWNAALRARERYARANGEEFYGPDDGLGVSEELANAFDYVATVFKPDVGELRASLESNIGDAFQHVRDVVAENLEVPE